MRKHHAIPQPREDDGGGFAEAGGDVDEKRLARGAVGEVASWLGIRPSSEAALAGVRPGACEPEGGLENSSISNFAHETLRLGIEVLE